MHYVVEKAQGYVFKKIVEKKDKINEYKYNK